MNAQKFDLRVTDVQSGHGMAAEHLMEVWKEALNTRKQSAARSDENFANTFPRSVHRNQTQRSVTGRPVLRIARVIDHEDKGFMSASVTDSHEVLRSSDLKRLDVLLLGEIQDRRTQVDRLPPALSDEFNVGVKRVGHKMKVGIGNGVQTHAAKPGEFQLTPVQIIGDSKSLRLTRFEVLAERPEAVAFRIENPSLDIECA